MKRYILLLVVFLISEGIFAQSGSDFYKIDYQIEDIDEGLNKLENKRFFLVKDGSYLYDRSLIDHCKSYLSTDGSYGVGEYINEYYIFYKESNSLNRIGSIDVDNLVSDYFNDIIAILRYIKTPSGVDTYFSLMNQGEIDSLYINGIKKSKVN